MSSVAPQDSYEAVFSCVDLERDWWCNTRAQQKTAFLRLGPELKLVWLNKGLRTLPKQLTGMVYGRA